jgi:hypothetical protein
VYRVSRELLVFVSASIVIAAMALMLGHALPPAWTPQAAPAAGGHGINGADDCLEAAVTALRSPGIAGGGWLCASGSGVRATLQLSGLTPGQTYSAWLGFAPQELTDPPTRSRTTEWSGGDPDGALRPLGRGIAPRAGELEFRGDFPDVRLTSQARVTILLLQPGGQAGPHARAMFTVP